MMKPAWELEQEARAANATDWQPPPGMVKRQCDWCRYFFAAPAVSHEPRCPDWGYAIGRMPDSR